MKLQDYVEYDGLGLATLIRTGEVSVKEVAAAALEAIDAVNPTLNAVIEQYPERATALESDDLGGGPLKGTPFLIKDLVIHEAGQKHEMGSRLAKGFIAPNDTELMVRYRNAGLVTLGRTTTPEFGYCGTTESVLSGPTRNPWNSKHSPGGSSGGSAAAVAARMVPIAHANDGGGSIRIPAACCGLVGMKPTRGRNSLGPDLGEAVSGFAVEHVVSRTVRDSAAVLDATQGNGGGDPYVIEPPERPYLDEVSAPPGTLKIAFTTTPWSGDKVDPETTRALNDVAASLEGLGHRVEEAMPRYDYRPHIEAAGVIWSVGTAAWVDAVAKSMGRQPGPSNLESSIVVTYEVGKRTNAVDYLAAVNHVHAVNRQIAPFFDDYDILMTPTCAQPAWKLGEMDANAEGLTLESWTDLVFGFCPFTQLFNATGQPAVSLPLAMNSGDLPIGIQFVGQWGGEALLYRLAGQLEQALPWNDRKPGICA